MDLVDEYHLVAELAELIFRVDEYQPLLGGHLGAALEQTARIALHHLVVLLAHEPLRYDLFARDILIVSGVGLGGGGDYRLGETLVLLHAVGKLHAAQLAASGRIFAPCAARQIAAYDHLHAEALAALAHGHHRIRHGQQPVGTYIRRSLKKVGCDLIEYLSLVGNTLRQYHIECRDAVGGYHDQKVVGKRIHVAYFSVVHSRLSGKVEICSVKSGGHIGWFISADGNALAQTRRLEAHSCPVGCIIVQYVAKLNIFPISGKFAFATACRLRAPGVNPRRIPGILIVRRKRTCDKTDRLRRSGGACRILQGY